MIGKFLNFLDVLEFRDNNGTFGGFLLYFLIIELSIGRLIDK